MTRLLYPFVFFLVTFTATAQQREYVSRYISGKSPLINGVVDDEAWKQAIWSEGFTQRDPYDGKSPSQQTTFKILYDDNNLYIAIKAYDSVPGEIVKRFSRRDKNEGDWVAIEIDSYSDKLTGFVFGITAAGVKFDALLSNDLQSDFSWDAIWYAHTTIDDEGWTAEMRIPLSQLRFARKESHTWGLQVVRYIYRKQEVSLWEPISRDAPGWVSQFGILSGIKGIRPRKEINLLPYASAKTNLDKKIEGNPFKTGHNFSANGGLDGKIALTNDLTLNFTINPDFGQVEADPSEMNLTAFETYYPEKRPFFMEGKNIFDFNLTSANDYRNSLFYSRRIGRSPQFYPPLAPGEYANVPGETPILASFKLSGKTRKGLSIGILESVTNNVNASIDSAGLRTKTGIEPLSNYFVSRVQQDFNKGKTQAGFIITSTVRSIDNDNLKFLPVTSHVGGIDFIHYWNLKTYYFSAKGVFSRITGDSLAISRIQASSAHYFQRSDITHLSYNPSLKSLSGYGATLETGKTGKGHWQYKFWLTMRSPGFDFNDLGYMRQADEIQQLAWIGYRYYKPFSIFRYLAANATQWYSWDFGGNLLMKGVNSSVTSQFKNFWTLVLTHNYDGESLSRTELRGGATLKIPGGNQVSADLQTDTRKKISTALTASVYKAKFNSYQSKYLNINISYRPLNTLQLTLSPAYRHIDNQFQFAATRQFQNQPQYILSNLCQDIFYFSFRIDYSITPDLSIQYYGQPYLFSGDYKDFKVVTNPLASNYHDRYTTLEPGKQLHWSDSNSCWLVDRNNDGTDDYALYNTDFSFKQFRSNLVVRWEYLPGSTLFLVWAQGRTAIGTDDRLHIGPYIDDLFATHPQDIFMIKLSHLITPYKNKRKLQR